MQEIPPRTHRSFDEVGTFNTDIWNGKGALHFPLDGRHHRETLPPGLGQSGQQQVGGPRSQDLIVTPLFPIKRMSQARRLQPQNDFPNDEGISGRKHGSNDPARFVRTTAANSAATDADEGKGVEVGYSMEASSEGHAKFLAVTDSGTPS